jgi:hypothetical protein
MSSCTRFCIRLKAAFLLWGTVATALVVLLIPPLLLSFVGPLNAEKQLAVAEATPHEDRHAVIAIPCPYAPYFDVGDHHGREWDLIAAALKSSGREPQNIFVSYEDAIRYAKSDVIAGVWVCGGMEIPGSGLFPSEPLLARQFVVVTLESLDVRVDAIGSLSSLSVATHPNIFRVLRPQLGELIDGGRVIQEIPNHLLLASLLITGRIDALITERSVFEYSLRRLSEEGNPVPATSYYTLFAPVQPRILFKDVTLRDRFDIAWRKSRGLGSTSCGSRGC